LPRDIALVIVDVQAGMFAIAPAVYRGAEVLATIGRLLESARAAGAPVIYVQHDGQEAGHPLRPDAPGWPIHPQIAPRPGETVIRKRFADAFQETRLAESLAAWGVRRLVLVGMQTDYCVDTTCRRAFSLGFEVTLAADAHTTWDSSAFWPGSGDSLRAEQIIAHYNRVLGDGFARVVPAAAVRFD
jgi:nicotinamidase-related amidase